MSIKPRNFVRRNVHERKIVETEIGYLLGSHIRKGLYEPVSSEISGLVRDVFDDPNSSHRDVDMMSSYKADKFEKAIAMRKNADVPVQPKADSSPSDSVAIENSPTE